MTDGILGGKNVLKLTNGATPGVLIKVEGLQSVTPPTLTVETVESTDQDSDAVKEFIAGLIDTGELTGTVKYIAGSPTDLLFTEHLLSRKKRPFTLDIYAEDANGAPKTVPVAGEIILTNYAPDAAPVGGIRVATFTAKVSGLPTQGAQVDPA